MSLNFDQLIEAGREKMGVSNVAICGLVRDCAPGLEAMVPQVERLGSAFRSYRVVVVENDSADQTAEIAWQWSRRNPRVQTIQFSYLPAEHPAKRTKRTDSQATGGWFGRERIERIAFARNRYLDALGGSQSLDYVIVIDLDIRSFSLSGVAHSFGLAEQWDIVTANGRRYSRRHPLRRSVYWDAYAYESVSGFIGGTQTPDQIRACQLDITRRLSNGQLMPAKSAFGGLGIYRASLLADHRYSAMDNGNADVPVLCEHHALHRSIGARPGGSRLLINPMQTVDYGSLLHLARYSIRTIFAE